MPQHPQYSNSPKRDLNKMYALLNELEWYGFVHEEIHQNIDSIMNELYTKAKKQSDLMDKSGDDVEVEEDDEDDIFNMSASSLFYEIPEDNRSQYIQDLRNVIAHCLFSNSWSTEGVAQEIIDMRDPDYYRMHVNLVEDTDTLAEYEYSKRTQWFSGEINPLVVGVYEVANGEWDLTHSGFAYWDGKTWYDRTILLRDCIKQPKDKRHANKNGYWWRGFTECQDD